MCREDYISRLEDLPETPSGLITMLKPGDFHGVLEWEVKKGRMLSYKFIDHKNAEVYHTRLSRNTEVDWHTHGKFSKEIIACIEGEILIIFQDGSKVLLKETDDYKIEKEVAHMAVVGETPCEIIAMTIPKEV